ncbi:MAG: hypothetical protein Q7T56_05400 [Nocardioidaceae bacterium]|nr:hypothetical protein [Nocardioidaceae bacterium]
MHAVTRPILPSADLRATADFYALLGFEVGGLWPAEYLILDGPDDVELHFWLKRDVDRWTNDVACWIGYPDADAVHAVHARWSAVDLPAPAELREPTADGHLVELALIDRDGNLLRVGAPRPDRAPEHAGSRTGSIPT